MQQLALPSQQMTIGRKAFLHRTLEQGLHLADIEAPALRPAKKFSIIARISELDFLARMPPQLLLRPLR